MNIVLETQQFNVQILSFKMEIGTVKSMYLLAKRKVLPLFNSHLLALSDTVRQLVTVVSNNFHPPFLGRSQLLIALAACAAA